MRSLLRTIPALFLVIMVLFVLYSVPDDAQATTTPQDTGSAWHKSPPLPRERYGFDACLLGDRIFVVGGGDEPVDTGKNGSLGWEVTRIKPVDIYNTTTRTWVSKELTELVPLEDHQLVGIGKNIYAIGGKVGNSSTNEVHVLSTSAFTWKPGPDLNNSRCDFSVSVLDDTIYAFGGRIIKNDTTTGIVEQVEQYSPTASEPSERKWKVIASEEIPTFSSASCTLDDKIYVFGGIWESTGKHKASDRVRIFDPSTREWSAGTRMPSPRYGMEAVAYEGKIYLMGGRRSVAGNLSEETVWCYDPDDDDGWEVLDDGWDISRDDFGAVGYGDTIYLLGGAGTASATDVVVHDFRPCELLITDLVIQQSREAGAPFTVNVTIKNIGMSSAKEVDVSLLGRKTTTPGEIALSETKTIPLLENGNETKLSFSLTPKKGGWYALDVKTDREDWIPEMNEENNQLMETVHVAAPDLVVEDITIEVEKRFTYRLVYITTEIRNTGEVDATDVTVEFFVDGEKIGKETGIEVPKGGWKTVIYEWKVFWNEDIDDGNSWESLIKDLIEKRSTSIDGNFEIQVRARTPTSAGEAYTEDNSLTKEEEIEMDILAYIIGLVLVIAIIMVTKRKIKKRVKLAKMRKKDKEKRTKQIPIIGTSQVGKTAYITMLDRELALGKEETDWRYTLLEGDEYIDRVRQWIDNGQHVPGTEKGVVERVKMLIETQKKKLELSVADVSGEDVTALITPGAEPPEHLVYVKTSEALIVLVDPVKASENQFRFRQFLASFAKTTLKKKSNKVIAVVFTKYDKFQDLFEGMTPEEFVKTKMPEVYNVLRSKYRFHQYFVCSAYGGEDQAGNPIRPPQPSNLTEPVKYILNTLK